MKTEFLKLERYQLDLKLKHLQRLRKHAPPPGGWIRAIRKSLGLTAVALAKRLGVTPASVFDLERSEANGTVTLNTLRKVAAAIDCEVIYAVVPTTTLDKILKRRAETKARSILGRVDQSMKLEAQEVEPSQDRQQIQSLIQAFVDKPKALWK